jgi:uncharacterized protein (TIGR03067 family)
MRPDQNLVLAAWALLLIGLHPQLLAEDKPDPAKVELGKLQGSWTMTALEINGERLPPEKFQNTRLEITGNRYITDTGRGAHEATLKLDPTKKPKAIDMTFVDGPNKGDTAEGIYKLDADTLTICRPRLPPHARPAEFTTKPGSDCFLVVWKRTK